MVYMVQRHETLRMLCSLEDPMGIFDFHDIVVGAVQHEQRTPKLGKVRCGVMGSKIVHEGLSDAKVLPRQFQHGLS